MTAGLRSTLYAGPVTHQRLRPMRHRLRYRVFSLLLDLDELPALDRQLRWFSLERFNLFSFHRRDHGDGSAMPLRAQIELQLALTGLAPGGRIELLCTPRMLGHQFNPLSVYFCHRPGGGLQAIVYEVHNTFGERHSYLIPLHEPVAPGKTIVQHCAKALYVSPFLGPAMRYEFRVEAPHADALSLGISANDAGGPVLVAHYAARGRALDDRALLGLCLSHPLIGLKVVAAIHWEALRLWLKKAPLHRHRPASGTTWTLGETEKQ
jgi:DUF1365 family protein